MSVPIALDTKGYAHPPPDSLSEKDDEEKALPSPTSKASSATWAHYTPPATYESAHRWDREFTWTDEEEKKLYRRLDLSVTLFACICFGALCLDRTNVGNATSDNFLKDLHMTTADYNLGQTIFYVAFLLAEIPSQLVSKKLGSDVWIPIQMMAWSGVTLGQRWLVGRSGFFATRALLGLFEGGFIADTVLYLSYYFTAAELTIRLSWFYVALTTTGIIGSFLAAGLLQLRHHTSWTGWQFLFLIEGILTFLIGAFAFFYLPPGPTQTAGGFLGVRGKGWFSEHEEKIIVNKVLRDDPTKSDMHNREGLSLLQIWRSFADWDLLPMYLVGFLFNLPIATVTQYFSLTLKSLGYTTFQTNMLQIPYQVLHITNNLCLSYTSRRVNERFLLGSIGSACLLVLFTALVTIPDSTSKWGKWAILSLIMGAPFCHPIMVSTISANSGSVRTRTVSSAVYNAAGQLGTIVASNIYQPHDAPFYHRGNRALIGFVVANLVAMWFCKAYYVWRNRQKERIWGAMSEEERERYLASGKDLGNKSLAFRFVH